MAHKVCHDIGAWVEEKVEQELEKCVEQDCDWWCACCNKWFCFLVWVIVIVVTWVVTTVCELVADAIDIIVAIVTLVINVIVGIVTWDFGRIWDALVDFVSAVGSLIGDFIRLMTAGGLISAFRDSVNKWRLRNYVEDLIDKHGYSDEQRHQIKDALGITGTGGFGFRLRVAAPRGFVRSNTTTIAGGPPDLVVWNNDSNANTRVDLKILAGFDSTTFWQRGRPELEGDPSEDDIDAYLASPTAPGTKQFTIRCMSSSDFEFKLDVAASKATELGLKLKFSPADLEFTRADLVRPLPSSAGIKAFLTSAPFNRADKATDPAGATGNLCSPLTVGTFLFRDNSYIGYSAHMNDSTCVDGGTFPGNGTTGVAFRDRVPDFIYKWVPIHELGHTFGLCHVDGIERVMYSAKEKSWWSWWAIPEYLFLKGEALFTLDEAKKVWDYIIANFSPDCLARRQW
jgi:hypothetical protein